MWHTLGFASIFIVLCITVFHMTRAFCLYAIFGLLLLLRIPGYWNMESDGGELITRGCATEPLKAEKSASGPYFGRLVVSLSCTLSRTPRPTPHGNEAVTLGNSLCRCSTIVEAGVTLRRK